MLQDAVEKYRALSLQTLQDVCESMNTSVDTLFPLQSVGISKVLGDDDATQRAAVAEQQNLRSEEEQRQANRMAQHAATARLLSATDQYHNSLGCATLDDDELRAVQSLPRSTLEIMVLRMFDGIRRRVVQTSVDSATHTTQQNNEPIAGAGVVASVETAEQQEDDGDLTAVMMPDADSDAYRRALGVEMGSAFEELVTAMATKYSNQIQTTQLDEDARRQLITTRRDSQTVQVHPQNILRGDVMILKDADILPTDALAVAVAPVKDTFQIETGGSLGAGLLLDRTVGMHVPCPHFASTTILPQHGILHLAKPDQRVVAVALESFKNGSFSGFLKATESTERLTVPGQFRPIFDVPLFVSPHPNIVQRQRSKLLAMSKANVLLIEREGVMEAASLGVRSLLWWTDEYFANDANAMWHFSDTTAQRIADSSKSIIHSHAIKTDVDVNASASDLANTHTHNSLHVSDTIGAFHLSSFVMASGDTSASNTSRIGPVGPNEALRRLMVAGLLATGYADEEVTTSPAEHAVSAFLAPPAAAATDTTWATSVLKEYTPLSKVVRTKISGRGIVATRLFKYSDNLEQDLCAAPHRKGDHGVLVVWGGASTVASMASHVASPKGILPMGRGSSCPTMRHIRQKEAKMRKEHQLLGVAIADIVLSSIGSKNELSPTDVAGLMAKSTAITYQGAFVAQQQLRPGCTQGLNDLFNVQHIPVGITTSSPSEVEAREFARRVGLPDTTIFHNNSIVAPVPSPSLDHPVVYYASGIPTDLVRHLAAGGAHGVAFIGGTPFGVAGIRAAHFGVSAYNQLEAPLDLRRSLESVADIVLKDADLGALAASMAMAREHIRIQVHGDVKKTSH